MFHPKRSKLFLTAIFAVSLSVFLAACDPAGTSNGNPNPGGSGDLGEGNGMVLTSGGHTWKLRKAEVYRYSPNLKRELDVENVDLYTYTNGNPTGWGDTTRYQGVMLRSVALTVNMTAPGAQTCAAGAIITAQAAPAGSSGTITYTATTCSVQVDYMSSFGGMSGEIISATLTATGGSSITIQNAPFKVYQHYGKIGAAPTLATDTTFRATLVIDSGSFELPAGRYFRLDSSAHTATAPGSSFGTSLLVDDGAKDYLTLYIASLSNLVGTYHCGDFFSGGYTSLQVWLGTYGGEYSYFSGRSNGATVASCTINVTSAPTNNTSRGNYTATLIYFDANATYQNLLTLPQRTIKIHGEFKH